MDDPDFFTSLRVTIIGLGLMGGSLALAIKDKVQWLGGLDTDPDVLQMAKDLSIFDIVSQHPEEIISSANVVILAAPVRQNITILQQLPGWTKLPTMVMDLGSTKREIVKAMQNLPDNFFPIGGHPMCGSEKSSIQYADPAFFKQARFILTPLERTPETIVKTAEKIIQMTLAHPVILDADTHDRITSEISHFPYLLSAALALSTSQESKLLISSGFKSTSRLAGSSPIMMNDILNCNRDNVLLALSQFKKILETFENALNDADEKEIYNLILSANQKYNQLME